MQMILPWKEADSQSFLYLLFFAVLHPASAMRTRWDIYVLLVMLALCLITPYTIGFDITPRNTSVIGVTLVLPKLCRHSTRSCSLLVPKF